VPADAVAASLADPTLLDLDLEIGLVYGRMRQELAAESERRPRRIRDGDG
jgi:hypothetical protein